jgi:hypothetical protein
MPSRRHTFGLLFLVVAGCAPPPDFPEHLSPPGPAPVILPLDQVLAGDPAGAPVITGDALAARAAALRARAAAMP